jgi:hypothetical protein
MIKLTNILKESESNLSYLDNKVYRKYLNVLNKKYPEIQNEVKKYVYPNNEWGVEFNDSKPYKKMFDFFGADFFNLDVEEKSDLIFLFIINLNVNDFLTEKLNVGDGLYFVTLEVAQEGSEYETETNRVTCDECNGRGSETYECPYCEGTGEISNEEDETFACDDCNGSGENEEECSYCGGDGEYDEEEERYTKHIEKWNMIMTEKPNLSQIDYGAYFIENYKDKVYMMIEMNSFWDTKTENYESQLPEDSEILDYDVSEANRFGIRYIVL